jgi:hypothetical protein
VQLAETPYPYHSTSFPSLANAARIEASGRASFRWQRRHQPAIKKYDIKDPIEQKRIAATKDAMEPDRNDGKEWSQMDVDDLRFNLENGGNVKEAATMLCRAGTVEDVRQKAKELGLIS